jgi:hypothetical protein
MTINRSVPLTIALLLAATVSVNAQGVSNCLANAARDYKAAWLSHCPGGVQYNFPACQLPPLVAAGVKADWATSRALCFEAKNAEMLDRADEVQRGPGLANDQQEPAAPATADNEPRRKFWISPQ